MAKQIKNKLNIKKIIIIAAVALLLLLIVAYIIGSQQKSKFVIKSDPVKASPDQSRLINGFGYPDTFVLAMDQKERVEVWNYYGLRRSFTFKDGVFINDRIIDPLLSLEEYPDLRPSQFPSSLSLAKASQIIGAQANAELDLIPDLITNAKLYNYADQVLVGIKDDQVVFVRTLPVNTK